MKISKEKIFTITAVLLTTSIVIIIFLTAELLLRIYIKNNRITTIESPQILTLKNEIPCNTPNIEGIGEIYKGNKKLGSFRYTIDNKGRRVTPQDTSHPKKYSTIFMGCSFTFGEGVDDDETLPAQFAKINPESIVFNYGEPANSPQEILIQVSDNQFYTDIPNLPAIFAYLYISHHLERLVGSWELIGSWGRKLPYVEFSSDGSFKIRGNFKEAFPIKYLISRTLHTSKLIEYSLFSTILKYTPNEKDLRTLCNVIIKTCDTISTHIPNFKFVVCLYPGASSAYPVNLKIFDFLSETKHQIIVIDFYSDPERRNTFNMLFEKGEHKCIDGEHPSAQVYKYLANWLTEDLKKLGIIN